MWHANKFDADADYEIYRGTAEIIIRRKSDGRIAVVRSEDGALDLWRRTVEAKQHYIAAALGETELDWTTPKRAGLKLNRTSEPTPLGGCFVTA